MVGVGTAVRCEAIAQAGAWGCRIAYRPDGCRTAQGYETARSIVLRDVLIEMRSGRSSGDATNRLRIETATVRRLLAIFATRKTLPDRDRAKAVDLSRRG